VLAFEVALPGRGAVTGVVLADHVKNLDLGRPTSGVRRDCPDRGARRREGTAPRAPRVV